MVESAIFFAVGFLAAALLALLAAPALSRRALRLATARARLQSPLTEAQARAERDALRAVQAVEIVKMEKKLAAAEWDRAVARAELGRQAIRVHTLGASMGDLGEEIRRRDARVEDLEAAQRSAEAEIGAREAALWDMAGQRDAAQARLVAARAALAAHEAQIHGARVEIATLSTQVSALEIELADLRTGKRRFGAETAAEIEGRLRLSETVRETQTLELTRLMRSAGERNAALLNAEQAREDLTKRLAETEAHARQVETDLRDQLQSLSTERATGAGALTTEREVRHHLQDEIDALKARLVEAAASAETVAKGDAALRLAIAKLGRDLVRARVAPDDEPAVAGQIVNFARREPTG